MKLWRLRYKLQRWKERALARWPLTTKRFMNSEVQRRLMDQSSRYERELEETRKAVDNIVARCSHHVWRQDYGPRYSLRIDLDTTLMRTGYPGREELMIIAQIFARRVEAEIATARFIRMAHEK